jgi:hypothetical protein
MHGLNAPTHETPRFKEDLDAPTLDLASQPGGQRPLVFVVLVFVVDSIAPILLTSCSCIPTSEEDPMAGSRARKAPGKIDAADREALAFFNKVVVDGRFVKEFTESPARVARDLGVSLSRAALARLRAYRIADVLGSHAPGTVMSPAAVAVVVAAIIVLWSNDPRKVVVDRSGVVKL